MSWSDMKFSTEISSNLKDIIGIYQKHACKQFVCIIRIPNKNSLFLSISILKIAFQRWFSAFESMKRSFIFVENH